MKRRERCFLNAKTEENSSVVSSRYALPKQLSNLYGQAFAAFGAAGCQYGAAAAGFGAYQKAVRAFAFGNRGLVSAFHDCGFLFNVETKTAH